MLFSSHFVATAADTGRSHLTPDRRRKKRILHPTVSIHFLSIDLLRLVDVCIKREDIGAGQQEVIVCFEDFVKVYASSQG
jgi:hypothetical protein